MKKCRNCNRPVGSKAKFYCSPGCYQRNYHRHFKRKPTCGMCSKRIKWLMGDGSPLPMNIDGTPHFKTCQYVSERRKKEMTLEAV